MGVLWAHTGSIGWKHACFYAIKCLLSSPWHHNGESFMVSDNRSDFIPMNITFVYLNHPRPLSLASSTRPLLPVKTNSVDVTISNFLEGKVQYNPVPTLQEATTSQQHSSTAPVRPRTTHTKQSVAPKSSAGNGGVTQRRSSGPKKPSLFSAGSSPALASMQRQLSLEERKRNLLEQARRSAVVSTVYIVH